MTDRTNLNEFLQTEPTSPRSTEQPSERGTNSESESETTEPTPSPSTAVVQLAATAFNRAREAETGLGTPTGIGAVYALAAALGEVVGAVSQDRDEAEENFKRALSVSLHRRNAVMAAKSTAPAE